MDFEITKINMDEILKIYEVNYREARKDRDARNSHNYAMERLREIRPETKNVTFENNQRFASSIGNLKQAIERDVTDPIEVIEELEQPEENTTMGTFRAMARTGFVAEGKYLIPLLGEKSSRQTSAYINFLRYEGWACEKVEFGWVTSKEKNNELIEKLDELKQEIKNIEEQLKGNK